MLLGFMTLALGLPILNPLTNELVTYPAFAMMAKVISFHSELTWGTLITVMGLAQLYGAQQRNASIRLWVTLINFAFWCYMAVYAFLSAPASAGALSFLVRAGAQCWVFLRLRPRP